MNLVTKADAAPARQLTIVALGASAGGIHALQGFFAAMPADERFAFVVITHLSPTHESQMAEVLAHATTMPVSEAQDGDMVEPAHVYVIPPDRYMGIQGRRLSLSKIDPRPASPHPIDHFMAALADDQQENAVGIVLSGADHDGTIGLKEIKGRSRRPAAWFWRRNRPKRSSPACLPVRSPPRRSTPCCRWEKWRRC